MLNDALLWGRSAAGMARLLRRPPLVDPEGAVRDQLAHRDERFLSTLRDVVFAVADHPYHQLFRSAGCTFGDLAAAVRRDGLEPTLEALQRAGVYLAHDEFKGKRPIRRSNLELAVGPESFANPLVRPAFQVSTSGSRSAGTRTRHSVEFQLYREALDRVLLRRLELDRRPRVGLYHSLPAVAGLLRSFAAARAGATMDRWFTVAGRAGREAIAYRAMTAALVAEARLLGTPACGPSYLPENDFSPVAERLASLRAAGAPALVLGGISRAVRVAAAAGEHGLDISGTAFLASGEAMTRAKRAVLERAGAEAFSIYLIGELGHVGISCRNLRDDNAVHLTRDTVAAITRVRAAPLSGVAVESLLLTTLLPCAPLVLVNVEMDDSARLETVDCGCPLSELGYSQRLRELHSYGKLTGQSASFEGSELLRLLEELLPARFGGCPADYQLVEREGRGQTEIELRVNPRLPALSAPEIHRFFLDQVRLLWGGSLIRREWIHTAAFRVALAEPIATASGKVLALHLLGAEPTDPQSGTR